MFNTKKLNNSTKIMQLVMAGCSQNKIPIASVRPIPSSVKWTVPPLRTDSCINTYALAKNSWDSTVSNGAYLFSAFWGSN